MTPERVVQPAREAEPAPQSEPARRSATILYFPALGAEKTEKRVRGNSQIFLCCEFVTLFLALPLVLFTGILPRITPLNALWVAALYCLIVLLRDPAFDRRRLWCAGPLRRELPQMLALFAAGVVVIAVLVRQYAPHLLLMLPRAHPRVWAMIMLMYPVASVYPQGIVYRAYFFHRYRPLMQLEGDRDPWLLILASAAVFSFVHILFHNWIAIALTFPGGILFARRYQETRSLCVSSVEHALYGCLLFTIGLGQFFGLRIL